MDIKMKNFNKNEIEKAKEVIKQELFNQAVFSLTNKSRMNLKWKWAISKQFLNTFSHNVFCKLANLPKDYTRNSFSKTEKLSIEDVIKEYAYTQMDWGRKRNIYVGENSLYPGMRIISQYSHKYIFKSYFADYILIFSRNKKIFRFGLTGGIGLREINIKFVNNINYLKELRYVLNKSEIIRDQLRISLIKYPGDIIKWNEAEKCFDFKDEKYHIDAYSLWMCKKSLDLMKKTVLAAFKKRKELAKKKEFWVEADRYLKNHAKEIEVNFANSIAVGNCEIGTRSFMDELGKKMDIELDNDSHLSADLILSFRNSKAVKMACIDATIEHLRKS